MVDMATGGEESSLAIMPSVMLEETQFFFAYSNIINSERGRIRKYKKKD
jgi:hypothetical protein